MHSTLSRAVRLCGTDKVDPPSRKLSAGRLSAEIENGALRYIRFGDVEAIRAIAFLVRDENWGTYGPTIEDLKIEEAPDRFAVSYRATCADTKQSLVFEARIEGRSDGSLDFEATCEPTTDVRTNRTGFVILHAADAAGKPAKVLHVDGREESSAFPETIDPMQPFLDIRSLSHEAAPGVWATCRMEGDTWEMEDQRNWSDASYKTYVRPLALPWPYELKKGETFRQSVSLRMEGAPSGGEAAGGAAVNVRLGRETGGRMPEIGLGVPADEAEHGLAAIDLVRRMAPQFLVCEIDARRGDGRAEMEHYRRLGEATGADVTLEIVIPGGMDPAAELAPIAAAAREAGLVLAAIAVFPAQDLRLVLPGSPWPEMPSADAIYAAARQAFPGVRLGGGMYSYFTELNRKRPPLAALDFVTHTTCSTVHAADDRSVMETLETLPHIIRSTRAFIGDAAYHVGPSAIGCRDNPYGKTTSPNPDNGRVCLTRLDPRQRGLFNAAWTLAYAAAMARGGVEALALGAPTGPFGFIHRRGHAVAPGFEDIDGPAVYPAWHVMRALASAAGAPLVGATVSRPSAVEALGWRRDSGVELWIANRSAERQEVTLDVGAVGDVAVLDADLFERGAADPDALEALTKPLQEARLTLDAYAVARVRLG